MKETFIKPSYLKPHYSTKICRSIFNYLDKNYGPNLSKEICDDLKVPLSFLLSDDNWISNEFISDLRDVVIDRTGDKNIYYKMGECLLDPENINRFEYNILKNTFPLFFFANFPNQVMKVNRILNVTMLSARPGKVAIRMTPKGEEAPVKEVSDNFIGSFYSIKELYQLDNFEVSFEETKTTDGKICWDYNLTYSANKMWLRRLPKILLFVGIGAFLPYIVSLGATATTVALTSLCLFMGYLALNYFRKYKNLVDYNFSYYRNTQEKNDRIFETSKKLDRRYQESNLLRDLSYSLLQERDPERIISSCLTDIEHRFKYEKVIVMLLSQEHNQLYVADQRGFHGSHLKMIHNLKFSYPAANESKYMFANILASGKTEFFVDKELESFKEQVLPSNRMVAEALNVNSMVISPIQGNAQKYGLIALGSTTAETKLTQEDKHLLENISRMFSLFFENAKSYRNEQTLREVFQQYVPREVLTSLDYVQGKSSGMLESKQTFITSFFCDLRGFTSMSETVQPEKVVDLINIYIGFVSDRLAKHGGIVANLIGDGIFAFFPANDVTRLEHATSAMSAALDILNDYEVLEAEFVRKGYPAPCIGMGLHSGHAIVGSVGAKAKLSYTAMGDTVNVSSRLETLSKDVNNLTESAKRASLVASTETFNRAKIPVKTVTIGTKILKGRDKPVDCLMIDIDSAKAYFQSREEKPAA